MTKVLHKAMFEYSKSLVPNFVPDYEDASVQALNEVLDNGLVSEGCWFHFSNSNTGILGIDDGDETEDYNVDD